MTKKRETKSWIVPVRLTLEGQAVVDAPTADDAVKFCNTVCPDIEPGYSTTDWEATGDATPNE